MDMLIGFGLGILITIIALVVLGTLSIFMFSSKLTQAEEEALRRNNNNQS